MKCSRRIFKSLNKTNKAPLTVILLLGVLVLSSSIIIAGYGDEMKLVPVAKSGKGQLFKVDKVNLIIVEGNYREMGRQYGTLLKKQIHYMYDKAVDETYFKSKITTYKEFKDDYFERAWQGMPMRQKQILWGISETADIPVEKLVLLDGSVVAGLRHINKMFGKSGGSGYCTFMSAWGPYTVDGKTVAGRNWNWIKEFQEYLYGFTVAVYKPNDGSNKIATVGYAGAVAPFSGINDKKLFIELNAGSLSAGMTIYDNRISYKQEIFEMLLDSSSMKGLELKVFSTRTDWANIINIVSEKEAFTFEDAPWLTMKREADPNGILAATNQYRLKNWGIPLKSGPDASYSQKRYNNILALGEKYKGKIDAKMMRFIFDQKLYDKDGKFLDGATKSYTVGPEDTTDYQIVTVPDELKIWVKIPQHTDWTYIDLDKLFNSPITEN